MCRKEAFSLHSWGLYIGHILHIYWGKGAHNYQENHRKWEWTIEASLVIHEPQKNIIIVVRVPPKTGPNGWGMQLCTSIPHPETLLIGSILDVHKEKKSRFLFSQDESWECIKEIPPEIRRSKYSSFLYPFVNPAPTCAALGKEPLLKTSASAFQNMGKLRAILWSTAGQGHLAVTGGMDSSPDHFWAFFKTQNSLSSLP